VASLSQINEKRHRKDAYWRREARGVPPRAARMWVDSAAAAIVVTAVAVWGAVAEWATNAAHRQKLKHLAAIQTSPLKGLVVEVFPSDGSHSSLFLLSINLSVSPRDLCASAVRISSNSIARKFGKRATKR